MEAIGRHKRTEISERMVRCLDCEVCAHAIDIISAKADLAATKCATNCENCKNLRHSYDGKPAVPLGGTCNTVLHVCPNDGNKWWQSNGFFHLWQQVTSQTKWVILLRQEAKPKHREEDIFF